MGLLMGCSRPYWLGVLEKIHRIQVQNGKWSWNEVRAAFPEISNSDMRRLNCSNWFTQVNTIKAKNGKTTMWVLSQDVESIIRKEGGKKKRR